MRSTSLRLGFTPLGASGSSSGQGETPLSLGGVEPEPGARSLRLGRHCHCTSLRLGFTPLGASSWGQGETPLRSGFSGVRRAGFKLELLCRRAAGRGHGRARRRRGTRTAGPGWTKENVQH